MAEPRLAQVPDGLSGERVDAALARMFGLSRSKAADLAEGGHVQLGGRVVGKSARVEAGQLIEVLIPEEPRERHEQHRRTFVSGPRARPMGPALELAARHADGSEIPVEISLAPLLFEGESVTMATVQ